MKNRPDRKKDISYKYPMHVLGEGKYESKFSLESVLVPSFQGHALGSLL